MRWLLIAKKDFEDSIRSKVFWMLIFAFVLFIAGGVYAFSIIPEAFLGIEVTISSDYAIMALQSISIALVPLIALVAVFSAIAGERDSGSLRVLMSFPYSRLDIVFGKFIGRSIVVTVPIIIGFTVATLVIAGVYEEFIVSNFLLFMLLTILLAWSFIGIGIGSSAAAKTKSMAMGLAAGLYLLFLLFWNIISLLIYHVVEGGIPSSGEWPEWLVLLERINPIGAYGSLSNKYIGIEQFQEFTDILTLIGKDTLPFYLTDTSFLIYILLWIFVPVILGYIYFERSDID